MPHVRLRHAHRLHLGQGNGTLVCINGVVGHKGRSTLVRRTPRRHRGGVLMAKPKPKVLVYPSLLAGLLLIASCGGSSATGSSSAASSHPVATPTSSASSPASAPPGVFLSATYGYTVKPPAHWTSVQASRKWDGRSGLDIDSSQVDQFRSPLADPVFWAVATHWQQSLEAFTSYAISWTSSFHGDSCTAQPSSRSPITVGGQQGVLLAYDCGVLINYAVTVHNGVGYWFLFKDDAVQAATDPTDHATFLRVLNSVQFPD